MISIPQQAPFRFVDALVSRSENEAFLSVDFDPNSRRWQHCSVPTALLIECIAQAAAAYFAAGDGGVKASGYLAQIDSVHVEALPKKACTLDIHLQQEKSFGALHRFVGRCQSPEQGLLIEARCTVAEGEVV